MAERKRYAIVGLGSRSQMYTAALLKDYADRAALVAFCDRNQTRMNYHNRHYTETLGVAPVPTYTPEHFDRYVRATVSFICERLSRPIRWFITINEPNMLVLNSYRLHQMLQLVRDVKRSVSGDLSMEWLKPFMTERKCAAGDMLFYKDEKAEDMLYIVSGRFRLVESGIELPVGAIVGELGMLSPSNVRTQSLECIEAGMILSVSYDQVEQLYVQNPAFGFYFLKLASARLFQNLDTLERRLAQQAAQVAQAKTA